MARLRHLYARTRTERTQAEKTRVEMYKVRFHQLAEQGNLQNVQSRVPSRLPINNARWFRSTIPTDAGSFSSSVQESYKCGRPGQEPQASVDASAEGVSSGMEEVQSQHTDRKWRGRTTGLGYASRSSTKPRECASSEWKTTNASPVRRTSAQCSKGIKHASCYRHHVAGGAECEGSRKRRQQASRNPAGRSQEVGRASRS